MELICLKMPQVNLYIGQDGSYRQQLKFGHVHLNQILNLIITGMVQTEMCFLK